mmetsp:Transcript_36092/g.96568  ORF Transcript_36092/g.96568 Transcript_36092/m.96568 type:complete len:106 (+) Transcript_36092:581-898(+)
MEVFDSAEQRSRVREDVGGYSGSRAVGAWNEGHGEERALCVRRPQVCVEELAGQRFVWLNRTETDFDPADLKSNDNIVRGRRTEQSAAFYSTDQPTHQPTNRPTN